MYIGGEDVGHRFGALQAPNQRNRYMNVQRKQYINIPGGCEEVCNQWVEQLSTG